MGLGGANCEKIVYAGEQEVFSLSVSERRDEPTLANVADRDVRGLCGRYLDFDYHARAKMLVACTRGERVEFIAEKSDESGRYLGVVQDVPLSGATLCTFCGKSGDVVCAVSTGVRLLRLGPSGTWALAEELDLGAEVSALCGGFAGLANGRVLRFFGDSDRLCAEEVGTLTGRVTSLDAWGSAVLAADEFGACLLAE